MTITRAGRPRSARFARQLVQVSGFVFYLLAVQALVTAGVGAHVFRTSHHAPDLLLPGASLLLAGAYAVVGFHLRRYRLWARNFAFAFAGISLFAFPIGTGLALVIVVGLVGGNRAGVFPSLRRRPRDEESPLLRFEPELVPERVG